MLATSSAGCQATAGGSDRRSRSVCRPSVARRFRACDPDSPRSSSHRSRPAGCRRTPTPRRSSSSIRALGNATCRFYNSWECAGRCPGLGRRSTPCYLRRRRTRARSSRATYPDTSPECCAMSRSDGRSRWLTVFRRRPCAGPWGSAAVAVDVWQSAPSRSPPPGRMVTTLPPRPCLMVESSFRIARESASILRWRHALLFLSSRPSFDMSGDRRSLFRMAIYSYDKSNIHDLTRIDSFTLNNFFDEK